MGFDAAAAKALKVGEHITFAGCPGLRLCASGSRRAWVYRYKSPVDGRMKQIKIGLWPAVSWHAAVVAWEGLRARRDAGDDPAAAKRAALVADRAAVVAAAAPVYTVAAVCADYLAGHVVRNRKAKGAAEVGRLFDKMLGDFGAVAAVDVSRAAAFDFINGFVDSRPVVASKLRCELGAAWDYAIDAGRLPDNAPNWWRLILRGKVRSKGKKIAGEYVGSVKRVLSEDELRLLLPWLPNFYPVVADVLVMYLWTGCRGAEICGMRGAEVSLVDGVLWWTLPKSKTKNARVVRADDLRVPLFGRAREVVERRRGLYGDGWLFPMVTKKGSIAQKYVSETVYYHMDYCQIRPNYGRERLPVSRWSPHDLRRTARTILARLGCPDAVGESILGHVLPGVVGVYNRHAYDAERVLWLGRLSDYLESL